MEYCFLTGFLVVLLIQRCKSEGHSTSIQSSTAVPLQDGPATPQEPEPAAEVVSAVAPPSLKEVQQAVQEASEQVETRGAEEVLKVLLERVVEAAWGQVEATGEVKVDEQAVREEEALEPEKEEVETNAEVLEKVVEGEDVAAEGEYNNAGEEQEVAVVDALEYVSEEGEGVEEREGETAAGSVVETGVGVEAEGVEVINKSLGINSPHRTAEDTVAALEETGGHTLAEAGARVGYEEEKGAAETERREVEETPAVVEVAEGGEAEGRPGSNTSLASADVQQIGDVRGNEDNRVDEMAVVPHSDDLEIESTQTVVGEHVEEINIVEEAKEPEVEDQQGHLVVGGVAAQDEGAEAGEESPIKGESVELANEGGDLQAGEEEQRALETSHGGDKEDQGPLDKP
ncbi:sodium/potassium/calcium exchanger 1-like [Pungitius pungitius]|uniref:sodium/potassium/calcium exchanger 1-like n=1 Tax=Pungitius pungitius TaxID=134920 RepID=UPI002E149125